jgi:hypothetical protein
MVLSAAVTPQFGISLSPYTASTLAQAGDSFADMRGASWPDSSNGTAKWQGCNVRVVEAIEWFSTVVSGI